MAIGRSSKGPQVIACGIVRRVTPRAYQDSEKNRDAGRVGEVYAYDATLEHDGTEVFVRAWDGRGSSVVESLKVGQVAAIWSEVVKGDPRFGDSLEFVALVSPDDLDRIHSGMAAAAK